METLQEAKQFLRDNWLKGTHCPCCNQFVKRYQRKLNSGMAVSLIRLYKENGQDWMHALHTLVRLNPKATIMEYSKLKYWGFLEEKPGDVDPSKKSSGIWRITDEGVAFIKDFAPAPKYIYLYNNKFLGFSDEIINIKDALGSNFDYQELMAS